jgi:hypothetical protein
MSACASFGRFAPGSMQRRAPGLSRFAGELVEFGRREGDFFSRPSKRYFMR